MPTEIVSRGTIIDGIEDVGILESVDSKPLTAQLRGKIVKMIPEGETVSKGDPVVWLDQEELKKRIRTEQIRVKGRRQDLAKQLESLKVTQFNHRQVVRETTAKYEFQKTRVNLAQQEFEKRSRRYARKLITLEALEEAQNKLNQEKLKLKSLELSLRRAADEYESNLKTNRTDVEIAQKQFEESRFNLESLERNLEKTILKSPADGIVIYRKKWDGNKFKVGDQVWFGVKICEIPDLRKMKVLSQIPESHLKDVHPGQEVIIEVNALNNLTLTGRVKSLGFLAVPRKEAPGSGFIPDDRTQPGKVFTVEIQLDKTDSRFRNGMGVSVTYVIRRIPDAIAVSKSAVYRRDGKFQVAVVKEGRIRFRPVAVGEKLISKRIISDGLQPGETIVSSFPVRLFNH